MELVSEYIQSKRWDFKRRSGELVIRRCPFCGDERFHFYMKSGDGVYFCHKCHERGNLSTLKEHLGDLQETIKPAFTKPKYKRPDQGIADKYYQALLRDQRTLAYLEDRKISRESIDRFKLGFYQENGKKWLAIPHFEGRQLVNVKFRSLPPTAKTFKRVAGCKSILFNFDILKTRPKEIYLTEGELDAITLLQEVKSVISGTTGAGSFDSEWIDQLKNLEKIFICYDADEAGRKGARSLAKRLRYDRCFNVQLPGGMDINDFFSQGNSLENFKELSRQAVKFELQGVISADVALDLFIAESNRTGDNQGLLTPWPSVNRLIKGFNPGDLVVLSAPPKTGKTTFALNVSAALAFQGYPVLFYCLEMRSERLIEKVVGSRLRDADASSVDIANAGKQFQGLPLYFAHSFKKQKLENVLSLIREAVKRYDLSFVVFDNLHFLIRSILNVNEELGQTVQGFKLLAEEMEIPIMTIVQPRKRDNGSRDEAMRADDIKYSNAVHADCDQMILLHRKRIAGEKNKTLDPVTLVRIEAHRYGPGGEALLYFHGDYSRFDPMHMQEAMPLKQSGEWGSCLRQRNVTRAEDH